MQDETPYVFPDKPAYGVPKTVDYTLLANRDEADEFGLGDGPGDLDDLPESDYPEEVEQ
jgi:hypothetical protein